MEILKCYALGFQKGTHCVSLDPQLRDKHAMVRYESFTYMVLLKLPGSFQCKRRGYGPARS